MEEITEKIRPIAESYNIEKVYLFGSYARGEAKIFLKDVPIIRLFGILPYLQHCEK